MCNAVTDSQIKTHIDQGARSLRDLNKELCIADQCGKCAFTVKKVIKSQLNARQI
ncbi:MAG: (2Fe-2S)-binding protein [Oceanospirillaceae bacterium]